MNSFIHRHGCSILLALFLFSVPQFSLVSSDWPRFRGPEGNGVSNDANVPRQWSDTNNLKWKLKLPGKGFSSPIVVGDYVFVTSYSDAQGDLNNLKRER